MKIVINIKRDKVKELEKIKKEIEDSTGKPCNVKITERSNG